MNFLAHLFLAERSAESIIGNLMADFVNGDFRESYHTKICKGIILHRKIDTFTDLHPLFLKSKNRINGDFRLMKGIMVDMFYDHFLARDWENYAPDSLAEFSQYVYKILQQHLDIMPAKMQRMVPFMIQQNWLLAYREVEGIGRALAGLSTRISRPNKLGESTAVLLKNYDEFADDFNKYFPQLIDFVKESKQRI